MNDAGVGIFDLTRLDALPAVPPGTFIMEDGRFGDDGTGGYVPAHNIAINDDSGRAYLIGVTQNGLTDDAIIILDLSDPLHPVQIGCIDGTIGGADFDSHDAQVVSYGGPDTDHAGREILFNYNGNANLPDRARTYIIDVSDLDAPAFAGAFDSPAANIDHNLFVKGDKVYQAHYVAGVRVLQIHDAGGGAIALEEIAHMDTEPRIPQNHINFNLNRFVGPWGVFPFFDSGTIAASDGLNGLVLMRLGS